MPQKLSPQGHLTLPPPQLTYFILAMVLVRLFILAMVLVRLFILAMALVRFLYLAVVLLLMWTTESNLWVSPR
jgi:hypothetical protein